MNVSLFKGTVQGDICLSTDSWFLCVLCKSPSSLSSFSFIKNVAVLYSHFAISLISMIVMTHMHKLYRQHLSLKQLPFYVTKKSQKKSVCPVKFELVCGHLCGYNLQCVTMATALQGMSIKTIYMKQYSHMCSLGL